MMEHLCLPLSYNMATPINIYDDDYDTNDNDDDDDYVKLNQHGGTRDAQRLFFFFFKFVLAYTKRYSTCSTRFVTLPNPIWILS